ncbi:MAG: hypothetical protein Q8O83_00140 [bacterium]|nr:hypothetical protein [bacterium]
MENIEQKNDVSQIKKPVRFGVWDWIVLIGAMIMLPGGVLTIIGDGLVVILSGKVDNFPQLAAGLFWIAISAWALKLKLKKFKETKTAKSYKILTIATWIVAALILIPTIFSIFTAYNNAKKENSLSPAEQQVVDSFLAKSTELQSVNEQVKLTTIALLNIEDNDQYNKKSLELLNYASALQIKLDDLQNLLVKNVDVFQDDSSKEAMRILKEVFDFRSEHNQKLIELAELGSRIDFSNEAQATKFLTIANELEAIEKRLPDVEKKFVDAIGQLDPKIKDQIQAQLEQKKQQNQELLKNSGYTE